MERFFFLGWKDFFLDFSLTLCPLSVQVVDVDLTSREPGITNQNSASLCHSDRLKDEHMTQAVRGFPQVPGLIRLLAEILHF